MSDPAAIETNGLSRRFLRHQAVREVSLTVESGSAMALIGANGAGKTTLMRILVSVLKPSLGEARILGRNCSELRPRDFHRIGYLTENQKLPGGLTVDQFYAYLRALYPNWDSALEAELRERFELPPGRRLSKLSHGMRMKAMLGGALAFRPDLLILDEPLSGLDPLTRDEVVEGLLGQAHETTILISSHELTEIDGLATHVAYMDRGRLLFQSTTEELLARFRTISATFSAAPSGTEGAPSDWLTPKLFGRTLRFAHQAFSDEQALRAALFKRFGPIQQLEILPMSLRDVSKALMAVSRRETRP